MEIQEFAQIAAIGAAGGAAGALLATPSIAAGALIGASTLTIGMIATGALENLSGALSWLEEKIGELPAFVASMVVINSAGTLLISQVAGLGIGLLGAVFPVIGAVGAFFVSIQLEDLCDNEDDDFEPYTPPTQIDGGSVDSMGLIEAEATGDR